MIADCDAMSSAPAAPSEQSATFGTSITLARTICFFLISLICIGGDCLAGEESELGLNTLAPGLDYGTIPWIGASADSDSLLYIIRFDTEHWNIEAFSGDSETPRNPQTWANEFGLTFVTNAGMYGKDGQEHVGYFRSHDEVHTSYTHPRFDSILATHPRDPTDKTFAIFDRDSVELTHVVERYETVVQNLRLIRSPRENRWGAQSRQWSEMAVAADGEGRIVFLFTPVPISMYEWNGWILSLPLDIQSAQHLEGGSDAQFYLKVGDLEVSQTGKSRLGLGLRMKRGSPVPNVFGLSAKK